ncbi:DUF6879 family protein [Streptomyces enissocaesilis]|uniref:DUF6879 family protein n=1 Tax=Streptomyces enissocaesilis TaxID=332589 RepID=UPI0031E15025
MSSATFTDLLATPRHTGVRLETRDVYAVGDEADDCETFLRTGSPNLDPARSFWPQWPPLVKDAVARGVVMRRARIATQCEVAPDKPARVSSLDFLPSYGLAPLGLALIAPATDTFGTRGVLAVSALTCFAAPAVAALVPTARRFFHRPASRADEETRSTP